MPDVALVTIHRLPDDPPTGDMNRVLLCRVPGGYAFHHAWFVAESADLVAWWAELPALPSRPEDRLTTEDVRNVVDWATQAARLTRREQDADEYAWQMSTIARLRLALGEEA